MCKNIKKSPKGSKLNDQLCVICHIAYQQECLAALCCAYKISHTSCLMLKSTLQHQKEAGEVGCVFESFINNAFINLLVFSIHVCFKVIQNNDCS